MRCCWCDKEATNFIVASDNWKDPACDKHTQEFTLSTDKAVKIVTNNKQEKK